MKSFAKKRYGQNFLVDPNILRKIIRTVAPAPGEMIVEIGAGKGALTKLLLDSGATIHAIEIDDDLIPELKQQFSEYLNFQMYHGNALEFDFSAISNQNQKIRIVGNIPYNITSPLLFTLFENNTLIQDIHFLVQREIARRICASPNNRNYGIISVITQFYGQPISIFDVSPKVFRPIPDVYSTLVSIKIHPLSLDRCFQMNFQKTVKIAFSQRRKTLRNALADIILNKTNDCPIDLSRRAESLNIDEFIELTYWIFHQK